MPSADDAIALTNADISQAMDYHEGTKHSELTVRMSSHRLDFQNKPYPFKVYTKLPSTPLPKEFPKPTLGALTSASRLQSSSHAKKVDIETVSEILFFSAGLTRQIKYTSGTYYMRAASATGALYPVEVYVVCQDMSGLKAGVYHFGPGDFGLTELRSGDYRAEVAQAGENEEIGSAPVTLAFTSVAWRNAWKYEARSYRHWLWDSGVIAANLLATAVSAGLGTELVLGFEDARVNRLLCLEERKEATIALAPMGIGLGKPFERELKPIPQVKHEVLPLSEEEVDYPEIWNAYEASRLSTENEVKTWVKGRTSPVEERTATNGDLRSYPLPSVKIEELAQPTLHDAILRRGSTRRFARRPISFSKLSIILQASTRGIPVDFLKPGDSIVETYFITNAVDGLEGGAYFYDREENTLQRLKAGEFRNVSGYLCLEQSLFADASVVFFLMTDLQLVLGRFGNRGYRAAQFEAGVLAGKIYLSAYAQGIGASGSTFYDDAVTEFFSPLAEGKSTMIAVGVGIPDYKARPGKILLGRLTRDQLLQRG
jgi:SagB-type dehydrogenase family enzyme